LNKYILIICALIIPVISSAQKEEEAEKKVNHYLSVQINELTKQIFNFGGSNTIFSPYFINYGLNSTKSGYGISLGFGYTLVEDKSGDELNNVESKNTRAAIRLGLEKKFTIGKKWIISGSIDGLYAEASNFTKSVNNDTFGNIFEVETKSEVTSAGFGIRGNIYFMLTPRIFLGTEASYTYKINKEKTETTTNSNGALSQSESSPSTSNITFDYPVVLWLTLKF